MDTPSMTMGYGTWSPVSSGVIQIDLAPEDPGAFITWLIGTGTGFVPFPRTQAIFTHPSSSTLPLQCLSEGGFESTGSMSFSVPYEGDEFYLDRVVSW